MHGASATDDPSRLQPCGRAQMIKAAIVGLGWWGRTIERELAASSHITPVLGVDPSAAARKAVAANGLEVTDRFEDALARNDIGAVILATPHKYHAAQI